MLVTTAGTSPMRLRYDDDAYGHAYGTTYFGILGTPKDRPPELGALYPVAFLIELDAETSLRPHFHLANQFQVFIRGTGTIGTKTIRGPVLHYADAYTPYGPIVAGSESLVLLTLRNSYGGGSHYMPESRDELRAAQRKPRATTIDFAANAPASTDPIYETVLLAPAGDGMRASHFRIAPGATMTGFDPAGGGGQCWLELPPATSEAPWRDLTCSFLAPDERAATMSAVAQPRDVLVLQFPRLAAA